jgi:hypothetical protein
MKSLQFHYANLARHGITPEEVEQCFTRGKKRYYRRIRRGVYQVIAQTASGRYLEMVFEDRVEEWYVFHAMDARPRDIKLLKRKGKRA